MKTILSVRKNDTINLDISNIYNDIEQTRISYWF